MLFTIKDNSPARLRAVVAAAVLLPGLLRVSGNSFASGTFGEFPVSAPAGPVITGISPPAGNVGATVLATISGAALQGASVVTFSGVGVTATIGTSGTNTNLPITIAISEAAPAGARTFNVTTAEGTSASFGGFTVTDPLLTPAINALTGTPPGLSQTMAPLHGKEFELTVGGQNFALGATISLGSASLVTTFVDSTRLLATVPSTFLTTAGTFPLKVTNTGGTSSSTVDMKVIERADLNAGRTVSIGDALLCALTAGGLLRPSLVNTVGDFNLSGSANIGDCLTLALFTGRLMPNLPTPSITLVNPNPAVQGQSLTISGMGFSATAEDHQVLFRTSAGITRVIPSAATTTTLTVTVPSDAVSGSLQVYRLDTPMGSGVYPLTVTGTTTPLLLTNLSPLQTATGDSITLTGLGFDPEPANNIVRFRSAAGTTVGSVTAATSTTLTVTVPSDALCGSVTVTVNGVTSNARTALIKGAPCALQFTDILGGGLPNDIVVIEGTGFDVVSPSNNDVRFPAAGGGTVKAPVLMAGATQLHVRIPENAVNGGTAFTSASSLTLNYSTNITLNDAFGRADSSALGTGWYEDESSSSVFQIRSDQIRMSMASRSDFGIAYRTETYSPKQAVRMTWKSRIDWSSTHYMHVGVGVRMQGTRSRFTGFTALVRDNALYLEAYRGASFPITGDQLAQVPANGAPNSRFEVGDTLELRVEDIGTKVSLEVWVLSSVPGRNGRVIGPILASPITGGTPGIVCKIGPGSLSGAMSADWDDFQTRDKWTP